MRLFDNSSIAKFTQKFIIVTYSKQVPNLKNTMSFPILLAADCSEYPPEDLVARYIPGSLLQYLEEHPEVPAKAMLWSRLILSTVPTMVEPQIDKTFDYEENFTFTPKLRGNIFSYCNIEYRDDMLGIALSELPISVSLRRMNLQKYERDEIRRSFPNAFRAWVDRQENPILAFYQLWSAEAVTYKKIIPLLSLKISDEDLLDVSYPSIYLKESLLFWQYEDWIFAVIGKMIVPLLTEYRSPEKTIALLRATSAGQI